MYRLLFLLLFLAKIHAVFAQENLTFLFPALTEWKGDTNLFLTKNGFLNAKGNNTSEIINLWHSSNAFANCSWEFSLTLNFNPSAENYAKIYLIADSTGFPENTNGYFIQTGGVAGTEDGIDLYRQEGDLRTKIISGQAGTLGKTKNTVHLKVTRSLQGSWKIFADTSGGTAFVLQGEVNDLTFSHTQVFGISYTHTSSRKNDFSLSAIKIHPSYTIINSISFTSDTSLTISFKEPIDISNASFFCNTIKGNPTLVNPSLASISFPLPFVAKENEMLLKNMLTSTGEPIPDTNFTLFYKKPIPYGALIINEILFDPTPPVDLPEYEYLELYNSTKDTISLKHLLLTDFTSTAILPDSSIPPQELVLLTSTAAAPFFTPFGKVIPLTPWPSLNNSGDSIALLDSTQNPIFSVSYLPSWVTDKDKETGGWSLEMKNPKNYCQGKANWTSSIHPTGGTPGKQNSTFETNTDIVPPRILAANITSDSTISIKFSEPTDLTKAVFFLSTQKLALPSFNMLKNSIDIHTPYHLVRESYYPIEIKDFADCIGNTNDATTELLYPSIPDSLDIILNEILFNPKLDGVDFIELFNNSTKHIRLKNWKINSLKGNRIESASIEEELIINPKSFVVLTKDAKTLKTQYPKGQGKTFFTIPDFPSFNNDQGTISLEYSGKTIDLYTYSEANHYPLLKNKEGISLERISYSAPTNNTSNWHSASSTEEATPGYKNSQAAPLKESKKPITISPNIISPNNDGNKDFATITYSFPSGNYTGSILIFDTEGHLIKELVNNQNFGREGFFQWDGTTSEERKAHSGIYLILVKVFDLKGNTEIFKEVLAVGSNN